MRIKPYKILEVICFICGFCVSYLIFLKLLPIHKFLIQKNAQIFNQKYETNLADFLENEIRILCWVFTHPDNHKKKVPHVKATWGHKCTKLLFMSTQVDPNNSDIIALPIENGRPHLWNKTKLAMKYVYEHHCNDAEWFMRADDDNFILMENLRYKLYQYRHQTSFYIGNRFIVKGKRIFEGYMAGGGHIFSKKALEKFITKIMPDKRICRYEDGACDDVHVGVCLQKQAIFVDAIDSKNQKEIFPHGVDIHMENTMQDMNYWYWKTLWTNVTQSSLECCSDLFIGEHYVTPKNMHLLKSLIYNVHPFGIEKNLTEELPRKLKMNEILEKSDAKSFSPYYKKYKIEHILDDDEKF
ncbi:hypothetical protein PVAND_015508 [Polypedilum vanderplanki]|uniref:N-acetylgalactosaminide beta-1,3-galactosyltransferase n=1 Tax=Polypedilum vanderplanki TaxID=319348 RepID=A0A9J6BCD1_POLVA|nr:hypothetical protein PVAND_015508 [Polypedilum vanderplanki]